MRFEVELTAQHLPILVAGDERDFGNVETGFEEAAGRFVTQVVEMQVDDAEFGARAPECGTQGFAVVGKDLVTVWCGSTLLVQERDRVVAGSTDQRYTLMVAIFASGVFAIADDGKLADQIDVGPH
jgi:hypothetical protein